MAFFSLGDFLINSNDVSFAKIEEVTLTKDYPGRQGYKIKVALFDRDTIIWSKFYEDYQTARTVLDGIRQYLNVRGLPEHKVRQEDKNTEFDPFEEDENGQDYFQRQTICQECQRLIDPSNHSCEGLQPRFYLKDLVDWDEAPPHANWAAQDGNGVIWFYTEKPHIANSKGTWVGEGATWHRYSVAQAIDWKKPLPRPQEEKQPQQYPKWEDISIGDIFSRTYKPDTYKVVGKLPEKGITLKDSSGDVFNRPLGWLRMRMSAGDLEFIKQS